jgi:predicted NAD-dependent protein-ADP-ribosyltransferase YbiA (DUF1768 family)
MFNCKKIAEEIYMEDCPRRQAALGGLVKPFSERTWNSKAGTVMTSAVWAKVCSHEMYKVVAI